MRAAALLLFLASIACAAPPAELIRGERHVLRRTCAFTFWKDDRCEEYYKLRPQQLAALIEQPALRAPPGLKAEILETQLVTERREVREGRQRIAYETYVIYLRLALSATAACAEGPSTVSVTFPRVLEARAELGAAFPKDATVPYAVEVFPSRLAALRARAKWLGSLVVASIGVLALAGAFTRRVLFAASGSVTSFRISVLVFLVTAFAAAVLLASLAHVMHLLDGSGTLFVLIAVLAANVATGGAVWVAGLGKPSRLDCAVPLFATGLVLSLPLLSPSTVNDFWNDGSLGRPDFVMAATAFVPALAIMLLGFSSADFDASAPTPEQTAADRERRDGALAAFGVPAPTEPALQRFHDDLYRAHDAAFAARSDDVAEIMEKLIPALANLPPGQSVPLRAAAEALLGVTFESMGRPEAARGAYTRALQAVPGHAFATRALARLAP
jgi:hypothetical protein